MSRKMKQPAQKEVFSCVICPLPDSREDMMQCRNCSAWVHYSCGGAANEAEAKKLDYVCPKCLAEKRSDTRSLKKGTSTTSRRSEALALKLQQLEEEKQLRDQQNQAKRKLQEKRRTLLEEEEQLQKEEDREALEYLQSKHSLEQQLEEESSNASRISVRSLESRSKVEDWLKENDSVCDVDPVQEKLVAATMLENQIQSIKIAQIEKQLQTNVCFRNSAENTSCVSNYYTLPTNGFVNPTGKSTPKLNVQRNTDFRVAQEANEGVTPFEPTVSKRENYGIPSTSPRQVMPKDLPLFWGNAEEWPIFYNHYVMTTEVCGYTDVENLARLQRSLKGTALDSVRSLLLSPSSVPSIISSLQILFGKPELILYSLIKKVRDTPAPKPERLDMLITFGMAVKNMCAHMIATEQGDHLSNPLLLQELIDKLPVANKMDWARYRSGLSTVNLNDFGKFMERTVMEASLVVLHVVPESRGSKSESKQRDRMFVNFHETSLIQSRDSESMVGDYDDSICTQCQNGEHKADACDWFKLLPVDERWKVVHKLKWCRTCFGQHGKIDGKWLCPSKRRCNQNGCQKLHHKLLHNTTKQQQTDVMAPGTHAVLNHHSVQMPTLFRIVPVTVHGKNRSIETFAMLDEGSAVTLMDNALFEELGTIGVADPLCLLWTDNVSRIEAKSRRAELKISGQDGHKYPMFNVHSVSKLVLPQQSLKVRELFDKFPHLRCVPVEDYSKIIPRILIGIDNVHLLVPMKAVEGNTLSQPIAVLSRLGWSIYGGCPGGNTVVNVHLVKQCNCNQGESLHELVKQYFKVESTGIGVEIPESEEDKRARSILEKTTRRVDGAFETGLLWRYEDFVFPSSFKMALCRLKCLERKLKKDDNLYDAVRKQIQEYQIKGYAHKATLAELQNTDSKRIWYLPLGVVVHPRKPGKVRLIWDASAEVDGISLNSMLLKGPDLLTSLTTVLSNFRQHRVAIVGDIEQMFHRIRICDADKQAQRFVWRDQPFEDATVFVMDVATFGSTCSPCSAQFVKNRNAEDFARLYPKAAFAIQKGHYVDDCLVSCDTVEEAIQLALQIKEIHAAAGFNIRNWISNRPEVLRGIGEEVTLEQKSLQIEKNRRIF
ncbi:uncharacterized protein LOC129738007 [Uranotaenia lowii]|uniref:uncharacterized protein LOC129738007 n=1 Tax=Uranotaenia lowii TaxID=190385 RepID=UPI002479E975|nr:uncharacterized protein LOC129738007 [Uranotaenia lowii]